MNFKPLGMLLKGLKIVFVLVCLASCSSCENDEVQLSEEHQMIVGKWFEKETVASKDTSFWDFRIVDLKWRSFEHYYRVDGKKLSVSDIIYEIQKQEQDTVVLISPQNKKLTLIRCKPVDSQINP